MEKYRRTKLIVLSMLKHTNDLDATSREHMSSWSLISF